MKLLKKMFIGTLCGIMLLSTSGSALAAETTSGPKAVFANGSLEHKVAVSTLSAKITTGTAPEIKALPQSKAASAFTIEAVEVFPLGLKDGQLYKFPEFYVGYYTYGNATNVLRGGMPKSMVDDITMQFEAAGFQLYGWAQETYYSIQDTYIPRGIIYFVCNYGTGASKTINLNSSLNNKVSILEVKYGVPDNSASPYSGYIYGDYASALLGSNKVIKFLALIDFNKEN